MKSKNCKRIIVLLLVTAMAVAIPGSFAKYVGNQSYMMSVKLVRSFFYNTYDNISLSDCKVELPYPGRYAIIVKGGDGATGIAWANKNPSYSVEGGLGGTVVGVYTTTKPKQYLYVSPGTSGSQQTTTDYYGQPGDGGKNLAFNNMLAGGKGAIVEGGFVEWLGQNASPEPAGGGGGAASVVFACDANGNNKELLMIAGGGGAGASWNKGYQALLGTKAGGNGGHGGGNYNNNDSLNRKQDSWIIDNGMFVKGQILPGLDAGGASNTAGKGGTTEPGAKGTVESKNVMVFFNLAAGQGEDGTMYSNLTGGNGGLANYYGGGGGAGYCGGGGGAGTSIGVAAGGGGGGSSYASTRLLPLSSSDYDGAMIKATTKGTAWKNKIIPKQYPMGTTGTNLEGDGYIIIEYLGPAVDDTTVPTPETKSFSKVLEFIVTTCSPNHRNAYNTKDQENTFTNSDTSNTYYKAVMADPCAKLLLQGRSWKITTSANGDVTIIFTEERSTNIGANTKFWKFNSNSWQYASPSSTTSRYYPYTTTYDYPTSGWNNGTFVLN